MTTKLEFIVFYTVFLVFVMQMTGMMAQNLPELSGVINGLPAFAQIGTAPTGILGAVTWVFANFFIFFSLMAVSSTFTLFGTFIITPYIIGLIWVAIDTLKDVIPFI